MFSERHSHFILYIHQIQNGHLIFLDVCLFQNATYFPSSMLLKNTHLFWKLTITMMVATENKFWRYQVCFSLSLLCACSVNIHDARFNLLLCTMWIVWVWPSQISCWSPMSAGCRNPWFALLVCWCLIVDVAVPFHFLFTG